ncbi:MAG TPA: hypothetical protein VKT18_09855, partial [Acidimicrobiales bacterium]|nr:hypothetical protein [Acidimicrobiales bacterium]
MRALFLTVASTIVAAVGCGSTHAAPADSGAPEVAQPVKGISDGLPSTCNPLRAPGICLLPWPNAIYLNEDHTTATGYRLALR